jgi:hypothetical protein
LSLYVWMPKATTFANFELGKSITLIMEGIYNTTHLSSCIWCFGFPSNHGWPMPLH